MRVADDTFERNSECEWVKRHEEKVKKLLLPLTDLSECSGRRKESRTCSNLASPHRGLSLSLWAS